jgi:uncharacterized protein YceK
MAFYLSGCGTMASIEQDEPYPNIVYGGLRNELNPVSPHTCLDIPFSTVADTLVLPYTIPRSIHNHQHPEDRPVYDDIGNRVPKGTTTRAASE